MKQSYVKKLLDHYTPKFNRTASLSSGSISLLCDVMSIFESKLVRSMKKKDSLQELKANLEPLVQIQEFSLFFNEIEQDKLALQTEEQKINTKTKTCKKVSDSIRYKFSFKDFKKYCLTKNLMLFPIPSELKSISDNGNQFSEKKVIKNGRSYLIPVLCNNNMIVDNENHSQYVYSTIMLQVFLSILERLNLRNETITKYEFIKSIYENKDFYNSIGMKVADVDLTKINETYTPIQNDKLKILLTRLNIEMNENISTLSKIDLLHVLSFELGNDKAVKTINDLFKEETIKESSKVSSKSKKSVSSSSKVKSSVVRKSMSARTSMRSYTKSPTSSRCNKYGIRSDGLCKKKPGRKSLSVKSLRKSSRKSSAKRSSPKSSPKSSPSRCKYGVRSDGLCKRKPGPKKSRRA